ncbi:MAG: hypothetical protein NT154_27890, partial [Verrucomicrobia bacterium]|nr:hypothetical protein [Verrucomicrobiota bacterium]
MRQNKSILLSLPVLLLGLSAQGWADAGDPGQKPDAPGPVETSSEKAGSPDSSSSKAIVVGPVQDSYIPLTGKERWNLYVRGVFWSPGVFFRAAGPALGAQLNNEPPEWGQGMEGYSKRFANRFARSGLQETYEAAGAALLQHEVRYIRSKRSGFLPRAGHALAANFVTYDRSGHRTPHISRIGSAFAAEFTGNLWMPAGYRDTSKAVRGVGIELGVGSAFNLFREFAP